MADPDLRYTTYLGLPYPAKDLDPWDDKYVEQMEYLDKQLMHTQQRASLRAYYKGWSYSWGSPTLIVNSPLMINVLRWGRTLAIPTGNYTIDPGYYMEIDAPDSKWDSDIVISSFGYTITPSQDLYKIPVFYNDGGGLRLLLTEMRAG